MFTCKNKTIAFNKANLGLLTLINEILLLRLILNCLLTIKAEHLVVLYFFIPYKIIEDIKESRIYRSRRISLIPTLLNVFSSTVFTITAQYRLGAGDPSLNGALGIEPGTTTE